MTIAIIHNRKKEEGDTYTNQEEATLKRALVVLLECEVAWGAAVMEVTLTKVHLQTEVMGCIDDTIFVGTEEEMQMLVKAAFIANTARSMLYTPEYKDKLVKRALEWTEGNPRLLSMSAPMIVGSGVILPTIIGIMTDNIDTAKRLAVFGCQDLLAMLYLMVEEDITVEEVIELAP